MAELSPNMLITPYMHRQIARTTGNRNLAKAKKPQESHKQFTKSRSENAKVNLRQFPPTLTRNPTLTKENFYRSTI